MLNKVILMGRLTRDPEKRYTPSNQMPIASFSLAVTRNYARQGEERQTDFINITAFGRTAEFVSNYFRKGQLVAVAGRIQTRSWDDSEGKKRYATDVIAEEVHFAEAKRDSAPTGNSFDGNQDIQGFEPTDFNDDDLPF